MLDRIGSANYLKLLKAYNFHLMPRMIGNPFQCVVVNYNEMWEKLLEWNGKKACFNSHNGFGDIRIIMGKQMPQIIYYTSIHHDFDNAEKIENAHLDCIKLSRFLDDEDLPRLSVFTGGKGLQCFLLTEPRKYKFDTNKIEIGDMKISSQDALKKITRGIQKYFEKKLGLRNLDSSCIGTPKKQSRALYTYHKFTRKDSKMGRIAIPLTAEQLYDTNIMDIIEYSHNPEFIIPEVIGCNYMTLTDIFEYFDIDLEEDTSDGEFAEKNEINKGINDQGALLFLDVVSESKPCITSEMMSNNPSHQMRIAFAVFAKRIGKSREWFKKVYESIGYKIPYVDIHNKEFRDYQIDWIWDNPNYTREATCKQIKDCGKCLKFKCRRYKDAKNSN